MPEETLFKKIPDIDFFFVVSGWGKSESRNFTELNWFVNQGFCIIYIHVSLLWG